LTITDLPYADVVQVAVESNNRGFIGFLVELPGAYVRGRGEEELLSKVGQEAKSFLDWLGISRVRPDRGRIVERHTSPLSVEDADNEILLEADKGAVNKDEFDRLTEIARRSGETFVSLYDSSLLKDWVDSSRARRTFYSERPKTVQEIFEHVERTQFYYLSRTGLNSGRGRQFVETRESCLEKIDGLFEKSGNSIIYNVDAEFWTLKKILRRYIWHDRIHGKAITRILAKQKQAGLIDDYDNPFRFPLPP
jgi:hypothetical protein